MKHYIAPIGAVAAIALLAACSGPDSTVDTTETPVQTESTDMADTTVDNTTMAETEMARPSYVMAAGEFEASDLIGDDITGADGEKIATVADVLLGKDGAPSHIVFRDGGVLGVAGDLGTLPFSSVTVTLDAEGEPEVSAALVDESLEGVAEFEQDGLNDFSLASELIGTNAELSVADNYTRITDLIMDSEGHVKHAVVTDGVSGVASTERLVIDFDAISVVMVEDDEEVMVNKTPEQMKTAPVLNDA
ncbi:MAG: PRC-barrel domain-containing protein [Alphaproteobacteria bacterium]|nr:PRC-barrel domain-containing protein [Alphaproteobacteria bacterium]MBU2085685.1 PRC-barrel domain-containing protein [Alphaproteobacteria bacterium]MBU2141630.1 PRC-barrel domain-containing protein [Alphaproteobacteria bacterium]MBU2197594.1 PRC-barrel domain-containing protein [Alphaproteobacteria bacterium]